ncbi:inositol 5-phosphatase [Diplodia corticola]|uniref:Inositol 5-phosphatase n=1 Tax=Diplodia corticola TaxID=236234 RepID=A0A1J9RV79_9PEZI|nr:inositol 5-phosphatase [Diplodia corticola]OJD32303.1 inositol 5-phosphatase [Diplodia corticola]
MLLYLVTFNLARALVDPQLLGQTLLDGLPNRAPLPDVIVCSLQEVSPVAYAFLGGSYLTPYFDRIAKSVSIAAKKHAGDEHAYRSVVLHHVGMTAIAVFAKPDVADRIRWMQTAAVGVGFMETGHKGAVGVRLALATHADSDDEVEMTFVAAHLAPMEDSVPRRLEDWEHIVRNLVFEPAADHAASKTAGARAIESATSEAVAQQGEQEPLISPSYASGPASALRGLYTATSHIFFAGDLNFRTHDTGPAPDDHCTRFPQPHHPEDSPQHYLRLLATDQLNRERRAGRILQGFSELDIAFPPTYKYSTHLRPDPTTNPTPSPDQAWAWAKHRWPSWCDRILFLPPPPQPSSSPSSPSFSPLKYTSLPLLPSSDHQPVALALEVSTDVPLAPPAKDASDDDVRTHPPFPLNPDWRARRDAARRREIAFGVLAYLTWTYEGNAVLLALVVGALSVSAIAKSFS